MLARSRARPWVYHCVIDAASFRTTHLLHGVSNHDLDCCVAVVRNQLCKPRPPLWAHVERNATLKNAVLNGFTCSLRVMTVFTKP